jgi:hypothetical protein
MNVVKRGNDTIEPIESGYETEVVMFDLYDDLVLLETCIHYISWCVPSNPKPSSSCIQSNVAVRLILHFFYKEKCTSSNLTCFSTTGSVLGIGI